MYSLLMVTGISFAPTNDFKEEVLESVPLRQASKSFDKTVDTVISSLSCRVVLSGAAVLCLLAAAAPSDSLPALPPPENYYLSDSLTPGRQSVCLSR